MLVIDTPRDGNCQAHAIGMAKKVRDRTNTDYMSLRRSAAAAIREMEQETVSFFNTLRQLRDAGRFEFQSSHNIFDEAGTFNIANAEVWKKTSTCTLLYLSATAFMELTLIWKRWQWSLRLRLSCIRTRWLMA
jgi:hypothetical protein